MKKILTLAAALSLIATLAVGGSIAYLQDTDEAVNVMTLGSVYIEQHEHQLADDGVTLEPFEQAKDFYPNSTISKIVTVENTGKSDAYFRTLIAFEDIDSDTFEIGFPINEEYTWSWGAPAAAIEVNGVKYEVYEALYKGVLKPGETSPASLTKVEMDAAATNKDMEALGSTYDILVLSQAVQTVGFDDAEAALDTAFGDVNDETAAEWFGGMTIPITVSSVDGMREAMKIPGAKIVLANDLKIDDDKGTGYALYAKYDCEIDLNGHDIIIDLPSKVFNGMIYALNGAKVDIVGEGDVSITGGIGQFVWCTGASGATEVNIYGGNWIEDSADFDKDYCEGVYANRAGVINIYGGMFNWSSVPQYTVNEAREGVINIYGGTFVNFDPRVSHDTDGSYVAEGCTVVSETKDNGDIWYTVVAE